MSAAAHTADLKVLYSAFVSAAACRLPLFVERFVSAAAFWLPASISCIALVGAVAGIADF
jgi:hypothetical protein